NDPAIRHRRVAAILRSIARNGLQPRYGLERLRIACARGRLGPVPVRNRDVAGLRRITGSQSVFDGQEIRTMHWPKLLTVVLPPARNVFYINSLMILSSASFGGRVSSIVSECSGLSPRWRSEMKLGFSGRR